MAKVAFIGLGVMGYPMAGHLKDKGGHDVTVWNRTSAKAEKWADQYGGDHAPSPRAAADGADFVFMCVGNDDDVRSVVYGEDGVFAGMKNGATLIDNTTASAELARELAVELDDRGAMARAIGYQGYGLDALDRPAKALESYRESMAVGERWLDLDALGNISLALIWHLFDRGYIDEAMLWTDRVCPRFLASSGSGLSQTHVVILFASCVHASKGRGTAALQLLARAKKVMRPFSGEVYIRASLLGCELLTLVETGQFDEMLDPLIDQFVALKLNPTRLPVSGRQGFFAAAYGLLQRGIQGRRSGRHQPCTCRSRTGPVRPERNPRLWCFENRHNRRLEPHDHARCGHEHL